MYFTFSEYFAVDATTGQVSSLVEFDREENTSVSFTVYARDNGDKPRNTSSTVTVTILDENDHAPVLVEIPPITIREDEPVGAQIGIVSASDADQRGTPNQQVSYNIVGGSGLGVFDINPGNGVISVA